MNGHGLDRRGFIGLTGLAAVAALGLTSCSTGGDGGSVAIKPLTKPSTKPEKIIVRSWGDPWAATIKEVVADPFTKATGIRVEFDLGDFGPTHVKIQQALKSGTRPPVDVVHTVGFFAEKARAQKLVRLLDPEVVKNLDHLGPDAVPATGSNGAAFTNLYSYTFPVIYDADRIDFSGGISLGDLADAKYAKSFFAASTFEVLTFPVAKLLGIDPTKDPMDKVWSEMKSFRQSLSGFGQDAEFVTSLRGGQSKMGAFIAGNGVDLKNGGMNVKWVAPEEGSSMTSDSLYVPNGLPDDVTYWSQVFINQWLDAATQTEFCKRMGVIPVNTKSSLADYMAGDPAFPFTDEEIAKYAIPVPLEATARNQDDWQGQYVAALQG